MMYAELHCKSNFSFLEGASHPEELIAQAKYLGYSACAITDECSLAGVVKAHMAAKKYGIHLIIGSEFLLSNGERVVVISPTRAAYAELSGFISLARRRAQKGRYEAHFDDLRFRLQHCFIIWLADFSLLRDTAIEQAKHTYAQAFSRAFKKRLFIGVSHQYRGAEKTRYAFWQQLSEHFHIPLLACGSVLMHSVERKPLLDVLCALRLKSTVQQLGTQLQSNAHAHLKPLDEIEALYPEHVIRQSVELARQCKFSLDELKYQYPEEVVPQGQSPSAYLRALVASGAQLRWPKGVPKRVQALIDKELALVQEMHYEYYFLTVYDIVRFAREQGILCQGRGSAANSVLCYCLHITEISPDLINVLFERFISKERDEPPDIDVDFEHSRREEVIQYIYQKYGRERAALAATVVTYKPKSAIRDVGRALGLDAALIDHLAKSLAWWDRKNDLQKRIEEAGIRYENRIMHLFYMLVQNLLGFPRHLSQHVGGFVITKGKVSDIVPLENAAQIDRTVIQWDKEDLEAMGLMKVDVLSLGMLTAIRKSVEYVRAYEPNIQSIADIPKEDAATYEMLCQADSLGVFQVESRAQISMLPRLKPRTFYDLVIQIAIVRPGPIQGGMVHPYLKRRNKQEPVTYDNDELKEVLDSTLGVPIFQEQAIRLSMVAAGFTGGEADQLRRAMASWGKNGNLMAFEQKFIQGMLSKGYSEAFAHRLFEQIKGFGGYGFPESHSASFAILCYFSSWLKCHHPAAFYCALLNSQPMGFYSPSQLIQDAQRHYIHILPIDINRSDYEHRLENVAKPDQDKKWGIRLGFLKIKGLDKEKARSISQNRGEEGYQSVEELMHRTSLSKTDIHLLASADALKSLLGHRHQAHWAVSGVEESKPLFDALSEAQENLTVAAPTLEEDITMDFSSTQVSLRPHIMSLLRLETPFSTCKLQNNLASLRNGSFVKVAGLVTGRQRPGTAKGTLFLTLEDETGNINVVVWKRSQEQFRTALLTGKLLLIKGVVETEGSVVHVVAGQIIDYSERLQSFHTRSRDFH